MEALTFRAEPEFVMALKAYADRLGISVNAAIKEIVAPVIGFSKRLRTSRRRCATALSTALQSRH